MAAAADGNLVMDPACWDAQSNATMLVSVRV